MTDHRQREPRPLGSLTRSAGFKAAYRLRDMLSADLLEAHLQLVHR